MFFFLKGKKRSVRVSLHRVWRVCADEQHEEKEIKGRWGAHEEKEKEEKRTCMRVYCTDVA